MNYVVKATGKVYFRAKSVPIIMNTEIGRKRGIYLRVFVPPCSILRLLRQEYYKLITIHYTTWTEEHSTKDF